MGLSLVCFMASLSAFSGIVSGERMSVVRMTISPCQSRSKTIDSVLCGYS